MTEQEARRKAIAFAVEYYHAIGLSKDVADWNDEKIQEYGAQCYQQAVSDMCAGEPEYWVAMWKGVPQNALAGVEHEDVDALCAERGIETEGPLTDWAIVPVKLVRCG